MKNQSTILTVIFLFFSSWASAQTITVSGAVKNENGTALPLAIVEIKSTNATVKVDSVGGFSLGVDAKAKLLISCPGYDEKQVNINNNKDLLIVLNAKQGTDINNTTGTGSTNQFANHLNQRLGAATSLIYGNSGGSTGALLPVFTHTEATRGNRYFFDDWVEGLVLTTKDSVIKNPNYHFNYDKISGALLLSQNKTNAIEIDKDQVKAFSLQKDGGRFYNFEYKPEIDKAHFVEILADGKKYKVYKQLNTRFVRNNYTSDGMTSRGNNYDEYVDDGTYYVLDLKINKLQKVALKKKALKEAFIADGAKFDNYLSTYTGNIDDNYITNLGTYLNQ